MAAALVVPVDVGELARELRLVPHGRSPRFHWRNEAEATRLRMLDLVRDNGLRCLATCYCADRPRWQERGRAKAFSRLLWEMKLAGVGELVLESRDPGSNANDRKMIARAQRSGIASVDLAYSFERPHRNPLLWVPDAIAGAVRSSYADGVDRYLDRLGELRPQVIDVDP